MINHLLSLQTAFDMNVYTTKQAVLLKTGKIILNIFSKHVL